MQVNVIDTFDERYEVLQELGRGGFGLVLKARQVATGQIVAIKRMLSSDLGADDEHRRRFQREMELIGRLRSAHVVRLMDAGFDKTGHPFMVLEYVEGQSLSQVLREQAPLSTGLTKRVLGHVLEALAEAHSHGIVHRDLKPDNIMLSGTGRWMSAKVLDFGIAGIQEGFRTESDQAITQFGQIRGTPGYMAPEQFEVFDEPCVQTDIYAMGIILIECLTGLRPEQGLTARTIYRARREADLVVPPAVLDSQFGAIVRRATRRGPGDRYPSANEMLDALMDASEAELPQVSTSRVDAGVLEPTPAAIDPASLRVGSIPSSPQLQVADPALHSQKTLAATSRDLASPAPPRPTRARWMVVAVLLLAVGGGGAFLALGRGETAPSESTPESAPPEAPPEMPKTVAAPSSPQETNPTSSETPAPTQARSVDADLLRGFKALQTNAPLDAVVAFTAVLDVEPLHVEGLKGLATAQLALGRFAEAAATLDRQAEVAECAEFAAYHRALIAQQQGEAPRALESYRSYLASYPAGEFASVASEAVASLTAADSGAEKSRRRRRRAEAEPTTTTHTSTTGNGTVVAPKLDID